MSKSGKAYLGLVGILILALLGTWIWMDFSQRAMRRRAEARQSESVERARHALAGQTAELLRLAALPLSWAVRTELIEDNIDQVDDYFRRFVKERHVTRVLLVDPEGMIRLSSDKKFEGRRADEILPRSLVRAEELVVTPDLDGDIVVSAPVVGYGSRLGTLVVAYSHEGVDSRLPDLAPSSATED